MPTLLELLVKIMPFVQRWESAPKNLKLPVLRRLPPEASEEHLPWKSYNRARIGWVKQFYHCHRCKAWIEGKPNRYFISTLDCWHPSGREGTEYYCKRCGEQIGFVGVVR